MAIQDTIHPNDSFARLTVLADPYRVGKYWFVDCICVCGTIKKKIRVDALCSGQTRSCGCLAVENGRIQGTASKQLNSYKFFDDYGVGYTNNRNAYGENFFLFDLEDYDKIKNYCWCFDKDGYLFTMSDHKNIKMHRLILDCPKGLEIDHIHYIGGRSTKNDNRKYNLRVCTHKENCTNRIDKSTGIIKTLSGYAAYKCSKFLGEFDSYETARNLLDTLL